MWCANAVQNSGTNKEGFVADKKKVIISTIYFHLTFRISLYFARIYYLEMKSSGYCILKCNNL